MAPQTSPYTYTARYECMASATRAHTITLWRDGSKALTVSAGTHRHLQQEFVCDKRIEGTKPEVILMCSASYKTLGQLKQHHQVFHDLKPFMCTRCGRLFADPTGVKRCRCQGRPAGQRLYECTARDCKAQGKQVRSDNAKRHDDNFHGGQHLYREVANAPQAAVPQQQLPPQQLFQQQLPQQAADQVPAQVPQQDPAAVSPMDMAPADAAALLAYNSETFPQDPAAFQPQNGTLFDNAPVFPDHGEAVFQDLDDMPAHAGMMVDEPVVLQGHNMAFPAAFPAQESMEIDPTVYPDNGMPFPAPFPAQDGMNIDPAVFQGHNMLFPAAFPAQECMGFDNPAVFPGYNPMFLEGTDPAPPQSGCIDPALLSLNL